MAQDDLDQPIDEDSKSTLEDVRKQKARHFVLIVKGAEVVKLIVQKKPIKEAQIIAAKKMGFKGEAHQGVCIGSGQSLTFEIVSEEAKEPCKTTKLRQFLAEHAEMKSQPEFKFVSALTTVSEDESGTESTTSGTPQGVSPQAENTSVSEDSIPEPPPPPVDLEAPPPPPPPPPVKTDERSKYLAALQKLVPLVKDAVAKNPSLKKELTTPLADIKQQLEDPQTKDFSNVKTALTQLTKKLKEIPEDAEAQAKAQRAEFLAALQELTPRIRTAIANEPGLRESLAGDVLVFKDVVNRNDFATARELYQSLLQILREAEDRFDPKKAAERNLWIQEFAELEPNYYRALQTATDEQAGTLRVHFAVATEHAEAEQYPLARGALEKLRPLIEAAAQSSGPLGMVHGIVEKRKFLATRWQRLPDELADEFDRLRDAIEKNVPDEDADAIASGLEQTMQHFCEQMQDAINRSINQSDGTYKEAMSTIDALRKKLKTHPTILLLQQQPFNSITSVRDVIENTLNEISTALSA